MARISEGEIERLAEARGVAFTTHGADLVGRCPFHGPDAHARDHSLWGYQRPSLKRRACKGSWPARCRLGASPRGANRPGHEMTAESAVLM
jgi:hypothetical protein